MVDQTIKKRALELSGKERAELAHLLIESINPDSMVEPDEVWANKLKERIEQFEEGTISSKPWDEIKKQAESPIIE